MSQYRLSPSLIWWILGTQMVALLPHASRIPWWILLLLVFSGIWRLMVGYGYWSAPKRWVIYLLALSFTASIYFSYGELFSREPGIALLAMAFVLKLLEVKSLRDSLVVIYIGFFLVAANFLYSQSFFMGVYMLASLILFMIVMIGLNRIGDVKPVQKVFKRVFIIGLQAAPVIIACFLLFPRIPLAFWNTSVEQQGVSTGFGDPMEPGSISQLSQSNKVAFRARFAEHTPLHYQMYWRGQTLTHFDGRKWTERVIHLFDTPKKVSLKGIDYAYQVTLEPELSQWVFVLEHPTSIPNGTLLKPDYTVSPINPMRTTLTYRAKSRLEYRFESPLSPWEQQITLQLPQGFNEKTRVFANTLKERSESTRDFIHKVLTYFREKEFSYTLEPPALGKHTVDEFLFKTKQGFCEHYASAFTFIMRAAGIPARVVSGYQGGELNPLSEHWIIRQYLAHAWTEVWVEDFGWVRVDPTAAVDPDRIHLGVSDEIKEQIKEKETSLMESWLDKNNIFIKGIALSFDALSTMWQTSIIDFTQEKQTNIFRDYGLDSVYKLIYALMGVLITLFFLVALIVLWKRKTSKPDVIAKAYTKFCRKMAKLGIERHPYEGPRDFADRVIQQYPQLEQEINTLLATYVSLNYANTEKDPQQLISFKQQIAAIKLS